MEFNAENLNALLDDHQMFHSDFQMDYLITVRAGGTPYGCYKQALRELAKRYRGLKGLYADRELLLIDIDELEAEQLRASNDRQFRRKSVEIAQKRMALDDVERTIKDTEREFARFYGQAVALKKEIGELTPERRRELDEGLWRYRLRCMAAMDVLTRGGMSRETLEIVAACPPDVRNDIVARVSQGKADLATWMDNQGYLLPPPAAADESDVRRLLDAVQ